MLSTAQRPMRRVTEQVEQEFESNVAQHEATVTLDTGLFRQIRCKQPGTFNRHFDITTWPGHLAITGDMGSFVFTRLADMFQFFRSDHGRVNYSYWAEKLVAHDKNGGHEEFSRDRFRQTVEEWLTEWLEGRDLTSEEVEEVRGEVRTEVLSAADDGLHRAIDAAMRYEYDDARPFDSIYECRFNEWTYHFAWCCHAIVWAINQYDARAAVEAAVRTGEGERGR